MCGRYVLFTDPELKEIREILEEVQRRSETIQTGEISPTNRAPILIQKQDIVTPEAVAWGFPNFHNITRVSLSMPGQRQFRRNRCSRIAS